MHVHWLRLFVVFQEIQCLLNFHYDVGHQGKEIYPCVFHIVFLCQLHPHTYGIMAEIVFLWFSKKYSVYIILTMTMFVTSQSFISLPSFMFVSAAVSEIATRLEPEQEGEEVWKL